MSQIYSVKLYTLCEAILNQRKVELVTIKPSDIGPPHTRGWISSDGVVYSGHHEHDIMLQSILKTDSKPNSYSGWIRWISNYNNALFLDWSEYGNDKSEALARSIAKQIHHPHDKVWIDAKDDKGAWVHWKGSVDDFIKFGIKGRSVQFESTNNAGIVKQNILKGVNTADADVVLSDLGFSIHINRLVARVKGGGRRALAQMCANADSSGVYLSLNACPVRSTTYPETMSDDALVKWYEGFGFKLIKPTADMYNSVFDHMSHLMLRYAKR